MRRGDSYQHRPPAPPASGYFYSRSGAPSPSHSHRSYIDMPQHRSRRSMDPPLDELTPSYHVEHLATFAVGRQFGLVFPQDGIRKLRRLEKNSAIYAQPLILRLKPQELTVEDENGDLVEKFSMELIDSPTPYISNDPRDMYNNILLFIVKDDPRDRNATNRVTEMHIFQCNRVAATDVAQDIKAYMDKHYNAVKNGRRSTGTPGSFQGHGMPQYPPDDASISSDSSELFERDVNTLNRCFDDIERFVARIQSAAIAQKELEQQAHRYRTAQRDKKRPSHPDPNGILAMRAQLPLENEFVDILRKFKLSFNLLAKLKSHIHEPNAPELLHFLFTPLAVILDACHWGLGRNIAPQVVAPLLSLEARELLQNCLSSKESDIWMSLGEAWRTPPEDWPNALPPPYRPIFADGFAPYGVPDQMNHGGHGSHGNHGRNFPTPLHRGESAPPAQYPSSRQPPPQRERSIDTAPNTPLASRSRHPRPQRNMSVDNLDLDRLSLERERMEFERVKIQDREQRLIEEERRLREERARVEAERNLLKQETASLLNGRGRAPSTYDAPPSTQPSPAPGRAPAPSRAPAPGHAPAPAVRPNLPDLDAQSPRQRAFVDDIVSRGGKLVMATFDRVAQNPKELTVSRGEYLEVLEDSKNWWECRNVHQRVGYVPHTILSVIPMQDSRDIYGQPMRDRDRHPSQPQLNGHHHASPSSAMSPKAKYSDAGVQANTQPVVHQPQVVQQPPQQVVQQQPQQVIQQPTSQQIVQQSQQQVQYVPQGHQPQYFQQPQMVPVQQPQMVPVQQPQMVPVQQTIYQPSLQPQIYQPSPQSHAYQQPQQQHVQYQPSAQPQVYQQPPQQHIVHVPVQQPVQPQYPISPSPASAPTPGMLDILRNHQAKNQQVNNVAPAEPARQPVAKASLLVTQRRPEEVQVINELTSTVGKPDILRPNNVAKVSSIQINDRSPSGDVARWLEDKGFSYRVLELFEGQDGAALFSLNRNHLIQACGRDEGTRLYSQILVQKNKSNYQTKTNAELKAILKMRKTHVEVTNTAPDEEPQLAVVS